MEKLLSTICALLLCTYASAYDFEVDGIYYNILSETDKTCEVTYKVADSGTNYYGYVSIPSIINGYNVVSIGRKAFMYCSNVTNITIPNSVKRINDYSFYKCTRLTSVTIPNNVIKIGESAFGYCDGLNDIDIPNSVNSICRRAFENCSSLTKVTLPNSIKNIQDYAFSHCSKLSNISIPNSVDSIGDDAFWGCSGISSIFIPESVKYIGTNAFADCNISSITISENNNTFDCRNDCNAIIRTSTNALLFGCKETIIPDGITSIESCAFCGCIGLNSINIPHTVKSIGQNAFNDCSDLLYVNMSNNVSKFGVAAFRGCSSLRYITIPSNTKEIGQYAFLNCNNLKVVFNKSNLELTCGCSGSTFPNTNCILTECTPYRYENFLISIYDNGDKKICAYYGSDNSLLIPSNYGIEDYAFYNCSFLTSVTIPSSVTSIGSYAFSGCSGLTSITNFSTTPQTISSNTFPEDGITLHVLPGYGDAYRTKSVWRDFLIKEDAVLPTEEVDANTFSVTDGSVYESISITHATTLNYSRTFNNTNWQALYIPFSMSYDDFSDDLEIAWLNNVHMYDDNNDGDPDRTMLEFYIMSNGETKPNAPYLVRSKETGTFSLSKSNADVYPAECDPFECSTFTQTFTVRGTYSGVSGADMYSNHYYAPVNGKLSFASSSNASLKPQRWYLKVTNKDGSNVTNLAASIRMSIDGEVIDEREETGICSTIDQSRSNKLYTLDGRRIAKPSSQGMFVQNNKIVIVK